MDFSPRTSSEAFYRDLDLFLQTPTQETTLQTRLNAQASFSGSAVSPASISSAALALFGWYPYASSGLTYINPSQEAAKTDVVSCRICHRRIGLWTFNASSDRSFDLVQEHLEWCPIRCTTWWDGAELLREKEGITHVDREWLKVSELLEEKPWRKRRKKGGAAI